LQRLGSAALRGRRLRPDRGHLLHPGRSPAGPGRPEDRRAARGGAGGRPALGRRAIPSGKAADAHDPLADGVMSRIALVSPYSWTYPGGVTRHIEALASELTASGHEPRIIAPFDPDDARSCRLHRRARPQQRAEPEQFVSLGRPVGMAANGAVSNP